MTSCNCEAWKTLENQNKQLLQWDPTYGWVLNWIELTDEEGYTQVHRYGVPVSFCPMCGNKLKGS